MEVLKIVFERAEALNGYWNLYIAVSLGVLGLMASGKPFTQFRQTKILLTIGFVAFALSNLDVILDTNEQRRALAALIEEKFRAAAKFAAPPDDWKVIAFHVVLDTVVALCIWMLPWHGAQDDKVSRAGS
jgi:AcrR family transcriptional regulator